MKLLVIDGNSMLHRAYYALPDWRNRSGEATAGVYGFLSMTLKAIDELKPTHFAVVFDTPGPNFRHSLYVGYQSTREKERQVSEDIWGQVEKLKIVLEKMGVPVFAVPGFEADDVIGTICTKVVDNAPSDPPLNSKNSSNSSLLPSVAVRGGRGSFEVIVITGDRDLMQLVNDRVKLYMPTKGLSDGQIVDDEKVMARLGVHSSQVIDYKGLVGDGSDNYPGVAGIGPKTAVGLLEKFGTLDAIYNSLDKIDQKLALKLANGFEAAKLSQKLATIRLDVPVVFELENAGVPSEEKIVEVLRELGYKSLIKRVTGIEEIEYKNQQKLFE